MVDFNNWYGSSLGTIDRVQRAVNAWVLIQRKPTTLTLRRINPATGLPVANVTVIVRVEQDNEGDEYMNLTGGSNTKGECVVYGVVGHPTVPDTNMQRNDVFTLNSREYRVISVLDRTGGMQFLCQTSE